ncbi:dTDP-4-dehydrorhamnose reductase [Streptomyces sp. NPDC002602]|uniref:dTDP-4-dehydrorhamnose reductase n=1 Tax=Streptomyces sp. NPDC002602 TaxID=3364654 RepID=UPI0036BBC706
MTRWLVTGAGGMLGQDVMAALQKAGEVEFTALGHGDLDITDADRVHHMVEGHHVVVNAAAWTDVEGAEIDESSAFAVNATGVGHLAAACSRHNSRLVHVSTDYVFSGESTVPWSEDDYPVPVNAYGRTKLAGEQVVSELLRELGYTVRTAWLYGANGPNFIASVLRLATDHDELQVVDDQIGQPTWSGALASRLVALGRAAQAGHARPGIYHGTASGQTSWYRLAREAFALAGLAPERIRPVSSDRYPARARRPAWSVLGHRGWINAGMPPLAPWNSMLTQAFDAGVFAIEQRDAKSS